MAERNHVIVLNERHLKRLLNEYVDYYHEDRTHLGLAKETPAGRKVETNPESQCKVVSMPRLGRFASPIPSRLIVTCPVIPRKTFQILHTKLARAGVSHLKASPLQRHQTVTQGIPRARPRLLTPDRFFAPKNCPPSQIEFWRGTAGRYDRLADGVKRVTGQQATSVREFVSLYADEFGRHQ